MVVLGGVAAFGLYLAYRANRDRQRLETFQVLTEASMRGSPAPARQPDMTFAARGFVAVALVRANQPDADLNALERTVAERMLEAGCSLDQALSARWGGVTAMEADLRLFSAGIAAYEETCRETGHTDDDPKTKYQVGATVYLGHVMADAPGEYERFRRYVAA